MGSSHFEKKTQLLIGVRKYLSTWPARRKGDNALITSILYADSDSKLDFSDVEISRDKDEVDGWFCAKYKCYSRFLQASRLVDFIEK